MIEVKTGRKLLHLFFLFVFAAAVCAGCGGTAKYQTMDLEESLAARMAADPAEMTVISMGETKAAGEIEAGSEETEGLETEAETIQYETVDETVVVTADVLNVRASESQSARIYVQLKNGDRLQRIGYSEQWSQVIYDGETAYVASDMVKVWVPESETAVGEGIGAEAGASGAGDIGEQAAGSPGEEVGIAAAVGAEAEGTVMGAGEDVDGTSEEIPWNGYTVAIDAGHQAKANAEKEPIGPSSETLKAKMPAGSVGIVSGVQEYELTLTVAKKLEAELKERGYHVVMIRTGHDVNLSNAERSIVANQSEADILIRLHANSMDNSSVYGALGMCMTAQNPYNAGLHDKSYSLSKKIIDNICAQTGTRNRGVQEVDNSGEINWCEIPVSVVEMGFLSNPDEDRWLQDESYQGKIVAGIAAAVDSYFAEAVQTAGNQMPPG